MNENEIFIGGYYQVVEHYRNEDLRGSFVYPAYDEHNLYHIGWEVLGKDYSTKLFRTQDLKPIQIEPKAMSELLGINPNDDNEYVLEGQDSKLCVNWDSTYECWVAMHEGLQFSKLKYVHEFQRLFRDFTGRWPKK